MGSPPGTARAATGTAHPRGAAALLTAPSCPPSPSPAPHPPDLPPTDVPTTASRRAPDYPAEVGAGGSTGSLSQPPHLPKRLCGHAAACHRLPLATSPDTPTPPATAYAGPNPPSADHGTLGYTLHGNGLPHSSEATILLTGPSRSQPPHPGHGTPNTTRSRPRRSRHTSPHIRQFQLPTPVTTPHPGHCTP